MAKQENRGKPPLLYNVLRRHYARVCRMQTFFCMPFYRYVYILAIPFLCNLRILFLLYIFFNCFIGYLLLQALALVEWILANKDVVKDNAEEDHNDKDSLITWNLITDSLLLLARENSNNLTGVYHTIRMYMYSRLMCIMRYICIVDWCVYAYVWSGVFIHMY